MIFSMTITNDTRTQLPIIALDFEGTLSPMERGYDSSETSFFVPDGTWTAEQWVRKYNWVSWLSVAQPVLDFFTKVHNEGRAEILWLTSYREAAHELIGETFDLPKWGNAPDYPVTLSIFDPSVRWWKTKSIAELLDNGRKVIWADDELQKKVSVDDPVFSSLDLQFVMIEDAKKGLEQEDLDFIENTLMEWEQ